MGKFAVEDWTKNWYVNAKPEAQNEFRIWLLERLHAERMNITFTKADGTVRHMHCSLHADLLPEPEAEKAVEETEKNEHKDFIRVFDLDKSAWRTVRLDRIEYFSYNLGALHI